MEIIDSEILNDLSTDQKYLYDISLSVQEGKIFMLETGVASRSPGALNNARWLAGANPILRLYTLKTNPS